MAGITGDRLMLDASKYAQHFPDESQQAETPPADALPAPQVVRPSLLAALYDLEREFREILLRAQQAEPTDRSA
jgi:hypothetical protein